MPELAEVEHHRRRWDPALGHVAGRVQVLEGSRVWRGRSARAVVDLLTGARLEDSAAQGKVMLFRWAPAARAGAPPAAWLGIHLGMTGELHCTRADASEPAGRHDHLLLAAGPYVLRFRDPRRFGEVRLEAGAEPPEWWRAMPPPLMASSFTRTVVAAFLARRRRSPIKAVLLQQERFPGIGNWMADEILWRAGIHPARAAGSLRPEEVARLWREIRWVAREALARIAPALADPPPSWLFRHRWQDGGLCPRTGHALVRETIGGRTTCWSPGRQPRPRR